ncbi:MAG: hypothetical protein E4H27_06465 [Anaerolineales bacterium]|nr:MAG: hypothetical protein E4H27_06465 [Anaerolineales bacterium]
MRAHGLARIKGGSEVTDDQRVIQFPVVKGSNLQRKKLVLPQDFQGEFNLVLVAFQQWQQSQVETWIPLTSQLEKTYPGLATYELPTIQTRGKLFRTFINEGMRAGIPNPLTRERTITLYLDKIAFRQALEIAAENAIAILLLNRTGKVLWRDDGAFNPEKGESLESALREVLNRE